MALLPSTWTAKGPSALEAASRLDNTMPGPIEVQPLDASACRTPVDPGSAQSSNSFSTRWRLQLQMFGKRCASCGHVMPCPYSLWTDEYNVQGLLNLVDSSHIFWRSEEGRQQRSAALKSIFWPSHRVCFVWLQPSGLGQRFAELTSAPVRHDTSLLSIKTGHL
jgi:hypothetical protein